MKEANPDPYKVAKDAVNSLKKRLPGVTPSGRFAKRASTEILMHSGILCVDVDKVDDPASLREKLESDPFVLTAFVSPYRARTKGLGSNPSGHQSSLREFFSREEAFQRSASAST